MPEGSRVEIPDGSGNFYRYEYDPATQKTIYRGPSGSAPAISEDQFLDIMGSEQPRLPTEVEGWFWVDPVRLPGSELIHEGSMFIGYSPAGVAYVVYHDQIEKLERMKDAFEKKWLASNQKVRITDAQFGKLFSEMIDRDWFEHKPAFTRTTITAPGYILQEYSEQARETSEMIDESWVDLAETEEQAAFGSRQMIKSWKAIEKKLDLQNIYREKERAFLKKDPSFTKEQKKAILSRARNP